MTNNNNNAVITDDDIKKAKDYKEALDNLRNSVIGLNSKLPSFADGMKAGLQAVGEKLPEVVESIKKLNDQNKELAASGQKPKNILKELAGSLFSLNSLVSVGITLLASYSGVIIDWVNDMIKGQTTLSALGKAMKDNAAVIEAINQTRLKGAQSAQAELTALDSLYRATQNHNLSLDERKRAINTLKDQFPQTFKNINDETILTGKAAGAYKNLTEQILASAYAEAYKNKITSNASRSIDNEQKIANERVNNLKLVKDLKDTEKQFNDGDSVDEFGTRLKLYGDLIDGLKTKIAASDKIIYNLNSDTKLLNQQNKKFTDGIDKLVEKDGLSILTGFKALDSTNNDNKNHPENKKPAPPKPDPSRHMEELEAISGNPIKKAEEDKKQYDKDLALLNGQLNKKLISQEDYNKQSQQLQDTYHLGIGNGMQAFIKQDMDATLKHLDDIATANGLKAGIENDEKNVKKAILPGQKLDTEKQLITDKYAYEIFLANGNTEKIKELEEKKQKDLTALTQQYEQQRKEFALNTAQQVSDKAFSIISNNIKSSSDAKIKGLEAQKAGELSNTNLTATQRKAIEDKYKKKEAEEKVKAFKAEQRASVLQAVVNGALAVTKATAQTGVLAPFVIPAIIASTALQVATIIAQKPPAFAKGGRFVSDGRGALLPGYSRTDNTNAYLRSGEAVVVSEAMRNPWARNLVSAINVAHGGRDFSMPNTGRGYAIGGIFTDGGNANRYYNQPVNDIKDMANTLAYQMINNFPPIYVDVKDVNNQQNILAQTVNRVNL
ncbi:hypothetical protein [Mucilaginibacter sp.]|jgi:hypothetical protein|uniref:hypothetical protein n=1 Tax=Mucilaginibacter sp. TaxID=1882438 RepID=UPI003564F49B